MTVIALHRRNQSMEAKVRLKKTLKCGKNVWEEGTILNPPLPPDILNEIEFETGTVEILQVVRKPRVVGNGYIVGGVTTVHNERKPRIIKR
jgi:hypothetical protein